MTILNLSHLSLEQNQRLNQIAVEIRQEFNRVVESISMPHVHNLNWIVSGIASRNKNMSPLFLRLCLITLVLAESKDNPNMTTLILSDRALAHWFRRYFRSQGRPIRVDCTESFTRHLWRLLRPPRQYGFAILTFLLRWIGRSKQGSTRVSQQHEITLIDTFVLNNKSGDEGGLQHGQYKDRYYPGLLEHLSTEERERVFFVPTTVGFYNPIGIFKQIRAAKEQFLIHDDFLTATDYLRALWQPIGFLNCRIERTLFRGVDITPLLNQEKREKCCEMISLLGILYYRFAARLAERHVQVRMLVEWHENQAIDRGMIVGFHRFHPETIVIGYQGYIIAKNLHFYIHPNKTELLGGAVPDVVYVVGDALQEDISEFCKEVNVGVAPGFRFQKLWRERRYYPDKAYYTILVGLPIHLGDCADMLQLLVGALPHVQAENLQIWIKPHPTWGPDVIRTLLPGVWPTQFVFKIGDFHDVLESADLLLTNASSVSLEALVKGVPVIIVGASTGITQNPIPCTIPTDCWKIVYTSLECAAVIGHMQRLSAADKQRIDQRNENLKKSFFEPVNRRSVLKFLSLEGIQDVTTDQVS